MASPDVLVAGETLIDFFTTGDEPISAGVSFESRPGGASANVAVGLARLQQPPLFWTRVGSDPFGKTLTDTLRENNVPTDLIEHDEEVPTTLAFLGGRDESREFSFHRNGTADTRLQAGSVPNEVLEEVTYIVIGGVSLSAEPARSAMFDLADRAETHECQVVFDPNERPELWNEFDFESTMTRFLQRADILKATPKELESVELGTTREMQAQATFDAGPHTLFRTEGADGATADASESAPLGPASVASGAPSVDVVDSTGAGDAFVAGVVCALVEGMESLEDVLEFATAVGGAATTGQGAMTALPQRGYLQQYIE